MQLPTIVLVGGLLTLCGGEPIPALPNALIKPRCDNHTEPPYPYALGSNIGGQSVFSTGAQPTLLTGVLPSLSTGIVALSTGPVATSGPNAVPYSTASSAVTSSLHLSEGRLLATGSAPPIFPLPSSNSSTQGGAAASGTSDQAFPYYYYFDQSDISTDAAATPSLLGTSLTQYPTGSSRGTGIGPLRTGLPASSSSRPLGSGTGPLSIEGVSSTATPGPFDNSTASELATSAVPTWSLYPSLARVHSQSTSTGSPKISPGTSPYTSQASDFTSTTVIVQSIEQTWTSTITVDTASTAGTAGTLEPQSTGTPNPAGQVNSSVSDAGSSSAPPYPYLYPHTLVPAPSTTSVPGTNPSGSARTDLSSTSYTGTPELTGTVSVNGTTGAIPSVPISSSIISITIPSLSESSTSKTWLHSNSSSDFTNLPSSTSASLATNAVPSITSGAPVISSSSANGTASVPPPTESATSGSELGATSSGSVSGTISRTATVPSTFSTVTTSYANSPATTDSKIYHHSYRRPSGAPDDSDGSGRYDYDYSYPVYGFNLDSE